MTFVIVIIYITLTVHLRYVAVFYVKSINNEKARIYAHSVADSGITKAKALLKLDNNAAYDTPNEPWANGASNIMQSGRDYHPDGGIENVSVRIEDESSKFNLLLLAKDFDNDEYGDLVREAFERLVDILRREDDRIADNLEDRPEKDRDSASASQIADAIADYIKDREGSDVGEDATFEFERDKIEDKVDKQGDWPAMTVGELLQAEYVTPSILYGRVRTVRPASEEDEDDGPTRYDYAENKRDIHTGREISSAQALANQGGENRAADTRERSMQAEPLALADFVTLWGDGRVNINTAPVEIILALSETITWEMAQDLIRARDASYDRLLTVEEGDEADEVDEDEATVPEGEAAPEEEESEDDKRAFRDGTGLPPAAAGAGATPAGPNNTPPAGGTNQPNQPAANSNDLLNAMTFYNRIAGSINRATGEDEETTNVGSADFEYEPVQSIEEVPQEWADVFKELQPFMTVRSEYFKITSRASAKEEEDSPIQNARIVAVFKRVVPQNTPTPAANTNPTNGTNPTPSAEAPAEEGNEEIPLPAEPTTRLELIFKDFKED